MHSSSTVTDVHQHSSHGKPSMDKRLNITIILLLFTFPQSIAVLLLLWLTTSVYTTTDMGCVAQLTITREAMHDHGLTIIKNPPLSLDAYYNTINVKLPIKYCPIGCVQYPWHCAYQHGEMITKIRCVTYSGLMQCQTDVKPYGRCPIIMDHDVTIVN